MCHFENENNDDLVQAVKTKKIDPATIAGLSPQELNPEKYEKIQKKKDLEEFNKNNQATTDIFKCSKCKNSKTEVVEKQTRAADEPATLFITCMVCGHKWSIG